MTQQSSRGFSLIEVLVAMLVVAVGILGVMGLQAVSLQQNRNTMLRDMALHAGGEMLDRIRANPDSDYVAGLEDAPVVGTNCITASCNPAEMAAFDIAQWKCQINPFGDDGKLFTACTSLQVAQVALPEGKGKIYTQKQAGVRIVTVEVQWRRDNKNNTSSITLNTQI